MYMKTPLPEVELAALSILENTGNANTTTTHVLHSLREQKNEMLIVKVQVDHNPLTT